MGLWRNWPFGTATGALPGFEECSPTWLGRSRSFRLPLADRNRPHDLMAMGLLAAAKINRA
jgi:hypothetical protein